jgi:hypothetical protein
MAAEAGRALGITIVAVDDSITAQDMVKLPAKDDIGARSAFEVLLVEALLQLLHKYTFTVDVNQAMAEPTARHFKSQASH